MASEQLHTGDKVTWQSHGSTAEGTVEEKITSDTKAAERIGQRRRRTNSHYRVRSVEERQTTQCTSRRLKTAT